MDLSLARRPGYRTVLVPYLPIEYGVTLKLARPFQFIGRRIAHIFTYLPEYLYSASMDVEPELYASVSVLTFLVYFSIITIMFSIVLINQELFDYERQIIAGIQWPITFFIATLMAIQVLNYPVLVARRRSWRTDKYLGNMLRHLTVEVRSGATLYQAMEDISFGDYDVVSKDIGEIVGAVNSGVAFEEAIEYIIIKTRSESFRRILLQLESAVKSGANMGEVLIQLTKNYFQEQEIRIQRYGKDLEFYSRVFLMVTLIMPVMFTIMLSMTALLPIFSMSSSILYLLLVIVAMVQIMFITYAREKRPPIYD